MLGPIYVTVIMNPRHIRCVFIRALLAHIFPLLQSSYGEVMYWLFLLFFSCSATFMKLATPLLYTRSLLYIQHLSTCKFYGYILYEICSCNLFIITYNILKAASVGGVVDLACAGGWRSARQGRLTGVGDGKRLEEGGGDLPRRSLLR